MLFQKKKLTTLSKISFSQCGEDLIVKFIFDILGIEKPSYIDIGAHDPFYLSNSALFYENGSRGINIEPDPTLFKKIVKSRAEDINLNIGISNDSGEQEFYVMNVPTLNTFSKEDAEKCSLEGNYTITQTLKIKTDTIQNIINNYANSTFPNFMSLDAEGIDEIIIDSIDFSNNYPIVICVETISFSNNGTGVKNKALIERIVNAGYLNYADTYINTIFVRKDNWIRENL